MPVFNSGKYLREAVESVLQQRAFASSELPTFELIIVDDHSTDPFTLEVLNAVSGDPRIKVFKNARKKGAAGARNTGIDNARGEWIAFLDSDDIWFPRSLALRWNGLSQHPGARWIAATFRLLKASGSAGASASFPDAQTLLAGLEEADAAPEITCYPRPVSEFGKSCMVGIMTVLIQRSLIVEKGIFNEDLQRSEDYFLWFKCAFDNDLWMVRQDVAFYRIHPDSLTHGNSPRHLHEDAMIERLLQGRDGQAHKSILAQRLDFVMQDHCYFYRGQKRYTLAFLSAVRWLRKRPFRLSAWKELVACTLRAG